MSTEYIESFLNSDSPIMREIAKSVLETNARRVPYSINNTGIGGTYYSNCDRNVSATANTFTLEDKITCINGIW